MHEGWFERAIDFFAHDGVAHLGHVDADLVGPAGLEPAGDQETGHRAEPLDDLEVGDGVFAFPFILRATPRLKSPRSVTSALSIVPDSRRGEPSTTARYWRSMS